MKPIAAALTGLALASGAEAQQPSRTYTSAPPAMQAAAPGLADYTDDVLFGEVWKRPGLSPRDRSLVVISALVAAGRAPQLTGHIGRGLDNGLSPAEVAGIITQAAFYEGWPVAVSAVAVADEVFKKRGVDSAVLVQARQGLLPVAADDPARVAAVNRTVAPVAPGLADLTNRVLFGDVWRRTDLSPRDRSLSTVAGLIAAGDTGQLAFYMARARQDGVTGEELGEAVTQLGFYAGWSRAMAAVPFLTTADVGPAAPGAPLIVTRAGAQPTTGPASHFTGVVRVTAPFRGTGAARVGGATVSFEPGARTNWHTHPLGQTLVVTLGHAWVQREKGPVEVLGPGDTVYIPPGAKHWHGATPDEAMTHIAIVEALDGKSADWLEPVTDAQYRRGPG